MTITAAADGSALGNPGPAGWAWYVDDDRWAAGGWPRNTNNVGELTAVLELLRATADEDDDLLILCDSQYAIKACTEWMAGWKRKGWRKADGKPVMNVEIIKELERRSRGAGEIRVGQGARRPRDERGRRHPGAHRRGGIPGAGAGAAGPGGRASRSRRSRSGCAPEPPATLF